MGLGIIAVHITEHGAVQGAKHEAGHGSRDGNKQQFLKILH